ncbi:MAG: 3-dehydroquinate synthase [Chitinophagaceae bacterium]|nr:3-dehydroquinate synthase [Chitinophagaceae bacterium]MCA6471575.1 3-dehydroquinate synthase [Chitinophagaceae bacterium]MCA6476712.1 3-dehydroquinate synthase [Chitinophagaceae bacterium]
MARNTIDFLFFQATVACHFNTKFASLEKMTDKEKTIIITDEHVFAAHRKKFRGWNTIVLKPGEEYKIQVTVDVIIEQLIAFGADRQSFLVGVGGGVITDITGYVAGIYMRGIRFGLVPTSLLAMVDAAIGGKNGIDIGIYKNMVGLIRQPEWILFDIDFLKSLPLIEWRNGFAEIIKHAAIRDAALFRLLQQQTLTGFRRQPKLLERLIRTNVLIKMKIVTEDEFEKGDRKLLNFGHTLGHAIENQYELSHGQAISIGMTYAALLSEQLTNFKQAISVIDLLERYGLPTRAAFDWKKVEKVLAMDKKKSLVGMQYVILKKIGDAVIHTIPVPELMNHLRNLN